MERLVAEREGIAVEIDEDAGQLLLQGRSEQQLEAVIDHLNEHGIEVRLGSPQIVYLEALMRPVTVEHTHRRPATVAGDVARVVLRLEPLELGDGHAFSSEVPADALSTTMLVAIERAVRLSLRHGPLLGMRVADTKVALLEVGGTGESTETAFEIATQKAIKDACKNGAMRIWEPMVSVEVFAIEDFVGSVIGDINSRRGRILDQIVKDDVLQIRCVVPLANIFGFSNVIRSIANEEVQFSMEYSHHELVADYLNPDDPRNFPPAIGRRA